eukprot:1156843_1
MAVITTFPAGDLEKFVLSSNRKKLLQIERDEDTKQEDDMDTLPPTLSSLYGSTQHTKYHLQQIENDITHILIQYQNGLDCISDDHKNALESLLNEANTIIHKFTKNKNQLNEIDVLHFRHKLRTLFLSPYLQMEEKENTDEHDDIYDLLINKLGIHFDYSKPSDVIVAAHDEDDNEHKISHTIPPFDVNTQVTQTFAGFKDDQRSPLSKRFNKAALPLLLEQDFTSCPKVIEGLWSLSPHVFAISNKTELAITTMKAFHVFDRVTFTKEQLTALGDAVPQLWNDDSARSAAFISLCMKKSFPTQLSFYVSQFETHQSTTFQEFVPRELAVACYSNMVQFVMEEERISPKRKAAVLFYCMEFRLKYCKEYDFDVFMEYIRIPKKSEYNAETRHDVVTRYIRQNTAQNDENEEAKSDGRGGGGGGGSMNINVKTLTGKTIDFTPSGQTTVRQLKEQMQEKECIPVEQQRFLFAGTELDDDRTLASYGIQHDSTIHLVLRLRGGEVPGGAPRYGLMHAGLMAESDEEEEDDDDSEVMYGACAEPETRAAPRMEQSVRLNSRTRGRGRGRGRSMQRYAQMSMKKTKKKMRRSKKDRAPMVINECHIEMDDTAYAAERMRENIERKQLYQEIQSTKEYQETYWYQRRYEDNTTDMITLNKFWCEYAQYMLDGTPPPPDLTFLSKWILLATANISEIICACAVLNLSFKSNGPQIDYDEDQLTLRCEEDASMVFIKQLVEDTQAKDEQETISVHVSYSDPLDPYEYGDDGETYDKFIIPSQHTFYTLKVYCCVVVLTNVSSMQQELKLLVEIPSGSIPCGKDNYFNKTHFITIHSYSTDKLQFYFYFPEFVDKKDKDRLYSFPIVVSKHRNNQIVSWTKAQKLNVVSSVHKHEVDASNAEEDVMQESVWNRWKKVSVSGDYDQILAFLSSNECNLSKMAENNALQRIYYLFEKKDSMQFWQKVVALCWNKKLFYDDVMWSFALKYKTNDAMNLKALFEYLCTKQRFMRQYLLPFFYIWTDVCVQCDKLPYFEYIPLINSRIHALGSTSKQIMNYNLRAQYQSFLRLLSYQSSDRFTYFNHNNNGQILLCLVYYLMVQDRVDDALIFLAQFTKEYTMRNINIDYLKCYFLLFNDENEDKNTEMILPITNYYLSKDNAALFPSAKLKWFYDLKQLLSTDDGDDAARDKEDLESMKSKQCSLSFTVDKAKKQLVISGNLVKKCNISFYGMNMELLFSIDPFTFTATGKDKDCASSNAFHYISPGVSLNGIDLSNNARQTVIDIPRVLLNQNTFIVVDSGDDVGAVNAVSCSDTFYDHQLIIQLKETYGQIKVVCKANHKPIKKAYIKVFAKMSNDKNEFYKDGYTDIRGGFDYLSVSSGQLQKAQKFAILIVTKEYGCAVKYANKPKT